MWGWRCACELFYRVVFVLSTCDKPIKCAINCRVYFTEDWTLSVVQRTILLPPCLLYRGLYCTLPVCCTEDYTTPSLSAVQRTILLPPRLLYRGLYYSLYPQKTILHYILMCNEILYLFVCINLILKNVHLNYPQ